MLRWVDQRRWRRSLVRHEPLFTADRFGATSNRPVNESENCSFQSASNGSSLNHFVCADEYRFRDRDSERLGDLQVDHELELGWLLHRQVPRVRALEDF